MFSFLQQAEVAYKWKGIIYPHLQECESLTQLLTVNTTNCQALVLQLRISHGPQQGRKEMVKKRFLFGF